MCDPVLQLRPQALPAHERTSDLERTSELAQNSLEQALRLNETCPIAGERELSGASPGNLGTVDVSRPLAHNTVSLAEQISQTDLPELAGIIQPETFLPGTLLDNRYEILERVAHDGMAIVYKALDRNRQVDGWPRPWVGLKFARPVRGDTTGTANHLRLEFRKLSQLCHPNIVAACDLASDQGVEFMVLEWLTGGNLADKLNALDNKRMTLRQATEIVRSVAEALAWSHAAGIAHGDVKPSNIFITDEQTVKVLDFGAPKQSPFDDDARDEASWATPAYASCAVLEGQAPQPVDDVYSLGVTAYYLLSGERPFGDLDAVSARDQGLAPKPLPECASDYWPAVERALRFSAAERFNNAQEFLDQFLDKFIDQPKLPPREKFQPAKSLPVPALAFGALAYTVFVAIVLWAIPQGDAQSSAQPLLGSASAALVAGRLIGPGEDTALHYYMTILRDDPQNPGALDGLDTIAEEYLAGARSALASENFEGAVGNLEIARKVQPKHFGIAVVAELIGRYQQDLLVSARRAIAHDLEVAERYLAQAAALSPENDPDIAGVREELRQERLVAELDALLSGIDQRILSERLTVPRGDSAVDLLRLASQLAPADRQVQVAADRIASALLFQSMFAISNGKLDAAQAFIDSAKGLEVKHLALKRAQYELARARTVAMMSAIHEDAGTGVQPQLAQTTQERPRSEKHSDATAEIGTVTLD